MNLLYVIGDFLHKHFEDFTKPLVIMLAIFGIGCAVVGHYGTMGFSWKWFLFFELPLYVFYIWALSAAYKIYKRAKELNKNV